MTPFTIVLTESQFKKAMPLVRLAYGFSHLNRPVIDVTPAKAKFDLREFKRVPLAQLVANWRRAYTL